MTRQAADKAEVICLPEHWVPDAINNIEKVVEALAQIATDTGAYIISGGEFTRRESATMVESVLLGPKGEVGRQQKTHLFGREKRRAIPGNALFTFDASGVKVGITICHDLVYPEVSRILALNGTEVLFAPARISSAGLKPWKLYVKVRALENRVPVVSPNVLQAPKFQGGSLIVGFTVGEKDRIVYPKVLASSGPRSQILVANLDLATIRRHREERLRARRPEIYSDLLK